MADQGEDEYTDYGVLEWEAADGLTLRARDYPGDTGRAPVICIPGLTRNARDFAHLGGWMAARPAGARRRLLMPDLRGRGASDYARDSESYAPKHYVADTLSMMDAAKVERGVFIGTSLGGIVTMLLAARYPERIAGALLNDIGPVNETAGLERIGSGVGQARGHDTWAHAARDVADQNREIFPDFDLNDWIRFAKKLYRTTDSGRIKVDYDAKIAERFDTSGDGAPALWKALDGLRNVPTVVLRGELSDLFSDATARQMTDRLERARLVTVPRVGHAPTLEEPASLDAIAWLLDQTD